MSQKPPIYLDYNGTTPIHPDVRKLMIKELSTQISNDNEFLSQNFGNPSAANIFGVEAQITLNEARSNVAKLLNCEQDEVYFTSGGTESNNTIIIGSILNARLNRHINSPVVITTRYEHPATIEVLKFCERVYAAEIRYISNDDVGRLNLSYLPTLLDDRVALVTVMWANNEFGTVNDIHAIAAAVRRYEAAQGTSDTSINKIIVHSDCAQAVGKVPVDVHDLDAASLVGHKLYAPKGIGALYLKRGTQIVPLLYGGGQEAGKRPGTENVLYAQALGEACKLAQLELIHRMNQSWELVGVLFNTLGLKNDQLNGAMKDFEIGILNEVSSDQNQAEVVIKHKSGKSLKISDGGFLPNTLSVKLRLQSGKLLNGGRLVERLRRYVAVAAGAACHAAGDVPSAALKALGLSDEEASATIRLSVGLGITKEACKQAGEIIKDAIKSFEGQEIEFETQSEKQRIPQEIEQQTELGFQNATSPIQHITNAVQKNLQSQNISNQFQSCLLELGSGQGCGCKLPASILDKVLKILSPIQHKNILVGPETSDDAAVYKLDSGELLVLTVDFFGPPVTNEVAFGAAAAANSLSDVYAMGGKPIMALSVASFPSNQLSVSQMQNIILGANQVCKEASTFIVGGHTIDAPELFFGLCCVGLIQNEADLKRNYVPGLQAIAANHGGVQTSSDNSTYLIITKPLGAGIVAKAIKNNAIARLDNHKAVEEAFHTFLRTLNTGFLSLDQNLKEAVTAMTDVTGFGLVGHLAEMLAPAQLSAELFCRSLPILPGVTELLAKAGSILDPGNANVKYAKHKGITVHGDNNTDQLRVVSDPCTSGGLLLAVQGLENSYKVQQQLSGQIIGRVYKNPDTPEILLLNEQFMPFDQRFGHFKE